MSIYTRRRATTFSLLLASSLAIATGCGTDSENYGSPESSSPTYLFERVAEIRSSPALDNIIEPTSLTEALPNHEFEVGPDADPVIFSFSDAVVAGRVVSVDPGDGYIYDDGDAGRVVDFDDPAADARDVVVTMDVDEVAGTSNNDVNFRMGVLQGSDPDRFMESLRGLGSGIVVLEEVESGRHTGGFTPVMSGALIGSVGPDGSTEFPALGTSEEEFVGSVDTVQEIFDETDQTPPVEELP